VRAAVGADGVLFIPVQAHVPILEGDEEGKLALLAGLEYLINISFVEDDEVIDGLGATLTRRGQALTEYYTTMSSYRLLFSIVCFEDGLALC
jgi:hypothetical protein